MTAHPAADFMPYPGFETQLLNVAGAQLFLVDGEASLLVERGDFVVRLAKQSRSPLAAVQASVGGVHWPLGKDSLTLKVKSRHYTFVLAGLMYGLVLPEFTSTEVLDHLEVLLAQYSTFQVHLAGTQWRNQERPALSFWTMVASELLGFSKKLWKEICDGAPLASSILENLKASASESSAKESNCASSDHIDGLDRPNPRAMKRVQRARRVSAVSKLLSRTLVQGALRASNHVAGLSTTQAKSGILKDVAVASVDAISKIMEAVESTGVENHQLAPRNDLTKGVTIAEKSSMAESANASWTLSNTGLALLCHITAASAKIHSKSNSSHQASTTMQESSSFHRYNSDLVNSRNLCDSRPTDPAMSLGSSQRTLQTRHFDSSMQELSSLPELSLCPSGPRYTSPAYVTQPFLSTIGTSPVPPSQKPIISGGRTAFMPPSSTYSSNMDTGGTTSRKQFSHPN